MSSKLSGAALRAARRALCALFLLTGKLALAAPQADPALPAAPGAQAAGAGGAALPTPPSLTSSALSGASNLSLSWGGYFEALAILCFVLAALWALLWLVKRYGRGGLAGGAAGLRVESRLALAPKKWILVVRCLDRRLVLGLTDEHVTLLTEIPPDGVPTENTVSAGSADSGKKEESGRLFAALLRGGEKETNGAEPGGAGK